MKCSAISIFRVINRKNLVQFSDTADKGAANYYYYYYYYYYYNRYSAFGPVWAETRAQSGDWYGSGTLHAGQVLRGSLPLLSPSWSHIDVKYIYGFV